MALYVFIGIRSSFDDTICYLWTGICSPMWAVSARASGKFTTLLLTRWTKILCTCLHFKEEQLEYVFLFSLQIVETISDRYFLWAKTFYYVHTYIWQSLSSISQLYFFVFY